MIGAAKKVREAARYDAKSKRGMRNVEALKSVSAEKLLPQTQHALALIYFMAYQTENRNEG